MELLSHQHIVSQEQMEAYGRRLAGSLEPGDIVALTGDLGAGKSTFARVAIRALLDDEKIDVPSPTFTLVQTYTGGDGCEICHADLYRLEDEEELYELGLDDLRERAIFFIEWPDKLPTDWHNEALHILIKTRADSENEEERELMLAGSIQWKKRLLMDDGYK